MSFLTLFTADAAAAHGHEFSRPKSTPVQMSHRSHRLSATTSSVPATVFETSLPSPAPSRKLLRSKTSYYLAQPPPSSHHSSGSLVVQLQKLSNITRPLPTFDVLPASVFAPRLKRKVGKFFNNCVGMQDLVFLTSEDFEDDDEESLSSRHVAASVSVEYRKVHGEEGKGTKITVIRLDNGPQWEISQTTAGGYEFVAYEDNGNMLVARWNPKGVSPRRRSYQTQISDSGDDGEKKFQFSLVDPNSKKHPILGHLTKQTIEINDRYPLPSISSPLTSPTATPPQSRPGSPVDTSPLRTTFQPADERVMVKTSENVKALMLVSGIWVALREGLVTSNMRLDEPLSPGPLSPSSSLFPEGLSSANIRPTMAGRFAADRPGRGILDDQPGFRRPTRTSTLPHTTGTDSHRRNANAESLGYVETPRRAHSQGSPATRHRAHTTGGALRVFGRSSPVPEASRATTRENTPEHPEPAATGTLSPRTPPTIIGCINRRFSGHRHTSSVSLPNSPVGQRKQAATQPAAQTANPTEEVRDGEREKKKWGKHIRGVVNMLRRATS